MHSSIACSMVISRPLGMIVMIVPQVVTRTGMICFQSFLSETCHGTPDFFYSNVNYTFNHGHVELLREESLQD